MNNLEKVSHETMVFMRRKYRLDEIGNGKDELKFKQGQRTILTIYIHDDRYTFLIIFGKKERECFEIKKKPNRKPFPRENAIYSKCGQRCDLCVHYTNLDEELRAVMVTHLIKMWGTPDWSMRCDGCYSENCYCKEEPCNAKSCASEKGCSECRNCEDFPCIKATAADYRSIIHTEVHYADEITWAILPYVPMQYESQY